MRVAERMSCRRTDATVAARDDSELFDDVMATLLLAVFVATGVQADDQW